jgi:hypothetical protein
MQGIKVKFFSNTPMLFLHSIFFELLVSKLEIYEKKANK